MEFFSKKQWIGLSVACVGIAAVLAAVVGRGAKVADYVGARGAVAQWEKSGDEEGYREMEGALRRVPGLEERYGAKVAQGLLNGGRGEEAERWALEPLEALRREAPLHAAFGEVSLMVERGRIQEALERSVALKEELDEGVLYGYNLLRIAFLQKELGNLPGEKAAWEDLEAFLKEDRMAEWMEKNFRTKGVDLTRYIAERKQHL